LETDEGLGAAGVVVEAQRMQRGVARPRPEKNDLAVIAIVAAVDKIDRNRQPHRRPLLRQRRHANRLCIVRDITISG
jgi:hypothetical protein